MSTQTSNQTGAAIQGNLFGSLGGGPQLSGAYSQSPPYLNPGSQYPDLGSTQNALSNLHQQINYLRGDVATQAAQISKLADCVEWLSDNPGRTVADYTKVRQVQAEFTKALKPA